jgi:hypothetical protein
MEFALKWKIDKEVCILRSQLDELSKVQRTVRKRIGDSIKVPPQVRGKPGIDKKSVYEAACNTDAELQALNGREELLNKRINAWNKLLSVNVMNIPTELMRQFVEEYGQYKHDLIQEAINTLFVYDSETKKFIVNT